MRVDDVAGTNCLALMHGDNALEGALKLALPSLTARRLAAMPTRRGGCGSAWAGATVSALVALGADADTAATTSAIHALLVDGANAPISDAAAAAAAAATALAASPAAAADAGDDLFRLGDACALYLAGIAGLVGWTPVLAAAATAAPPGTLAARVLCCGLPAAAASLESHLVSSEVGRCRLNRVETCVESAWFQRLKLNYDEPLSSFAFNFNSRHYTAAGELLRPVRGTG